MGIGKVGSEKTIVSTGEEGVQPMCIKKRGAIQKDRQISETEESFRRGGLLRLSKTAFSMQRTHTRKNSIQYRTNPSDSLSEKKIRFRRERGQRLWRRGKGGR